MGLRLRAGGEGAGTADSCSAGAASSAAGSSASTAGASASSASAAAATARHAGVEGVTVLVDMQWLAMRRACDLA